jgi:hypothetical protein
MASPADFLDRLLDPVGRALTPEAAKRLIALRADAAAQGRIDELAERANEGILTTEERGEYESLIAAAGVVALLQTKARAILAATPAA